MGLFDLTRETAAENLNVFLQHYNPGSESGGVPFCMVMTHRAGSRSTRGSSHCVKKDGKLGIAVDMTYECTPLYRERDICVMERFVELGIQGK